MFKLTPHPTLKMIAVVSLFLMITNSCKKEPIRQENTKSSFKGERSKGYSTIDSQIPCKYYISAIAGMLTGPISNPNFSQVRDYIESWGDEVCNRGHDSRALALAALHYYEQGASNYALGYGFSWTGNGPLLEDPIIEDCNGTYIPPVPSGGPGNVTLPPLPSPTDTLSKIMLTSNLSAAQLESLRSLLSRFLSGDGNSEWACIHKQLYRHMATNNLKFGFAMNQNIQAYQSYNPVSQTFSFNNNDSFIFTNTFEHEFFHSYQDMSIGTDGYAIGTVAGGYPDGYTNIEFETALFGDILKSRPESTAFVNANVSPELLLEYNTWLNSITMNNTKYPKTFEDLGGKYNYFLKKFKLYSGYADKGEILLNLKPVSLLNLFSTSPCK
ncbi:hypothetical protein [Pedobacter metabolipauper]|uniref:Uncharacterized protein n=1 Tax=Pedobacter metabolipauper TaxID=425513 RepID=A0A4R6SVU2_9SPHI|nr:hypothetical protein [Pedobacter metabolipauper]TDQ08232.1 hypothetical protein ATK78_2740 [Pedobacter metabolipauper]